MPDDSSRLPNDLLAHAEFVRSLARAALRGDPECEDLEQDAWVAALEGAPKEPSRQRPWLAAVVRNRAVDFLRRRSRRLARERAASRLESAPSTSDLAERAETGRRLVAAVLALDETYRSVLLLRFQESLPPREIAKRLGVPVETVRTRIRRGLARLRVLLEEGDGRRRRSWALSLAPLADSSEITVIGAIAMKKFAVGTLALLLLGGGTWWGVENLGRSGEPPREPAPEAATAAPPKTEGTTPTLAVSTKSERGPRANPAATKPTGSVIRGRVEDEDGKPVPNARVRCAPAGHDDFLKGEEATPSGVAPPAATSGPDGLFEISLPFFVNQQSLAVRAPGYVLRDGGYWHAVDWVPGAADLVIVLRRGVLVRVRSLDAATRAALAGARVLLYEGGAYVPLMSQALDEDTTDAAGEARLTAPGGEIAVVVVAAGKAQASMHPVTASAPGVVVEVLVGAGGTVRGVVRDPAGRAVSGARLTLLRYPTVRMIATTGPEGTFEFAAVPSPSVGVAGFDSTRLVTIACEAEGFGRQWLALPSPAEGGSSEVSFGLVALRTVTVTVRDPAGNPVTSLPWTYGLQEGGPEWGWSRFDQAGRPGQRTGSDGTFKVESVPPGRLLLWVGAIKGLDTDHASLVTAIRGDVPTPPLEIVYAGLPAKRRVRVLDATGRMVAGAHVAAYLDGVIDGGSRPEAVTDSGGEATLALDSPGAWKLFVDPPGAGPALFGVAAASGTEEPTVFHLGEGRIEGRVVRLDGSPARVQLALEVIHRAPNVAIVLRGQLGRATADDQGRVRFEGVSAGGHRLAVATAGWHLLEAPRDLVAGGPPFTVQVVDDVESAALTLAADVVDAASGGAITSVQVSALDAGGVERAWLYTTVQQPATFRANDPVRPGTYTVTARAPGYEPAAASVTVSASGPAVHPRLALRAK